MDNAIIIGSVGQALIFKAEYYVQEAASALSALTAPTLHVFTNPSAPNLPTLPDTPTTPTAPTLSFSAAESTLTLVSSEIVAAKAHHTTGAALANTATRGDRPADIYGGYAGTIMEGAGHRINEALAKVRIQEDAISKYASEVAAYGSKVNQYANEMSGTMGKYREQIEGERAAVTANTAMIAKYETQAKEQEMKARNFLDIAGRYLASGQSKINEMLIMLGVKPEFYMVKAHSEQRD